MEEERQRVERRESLGKDGRKYSSQEMVYFDRQEKDEVDRKHSINSVSHLIQLECVSLLASMYKAQSLFLLI